jgi:hypothetical protein
MNDIVEKPIRWAEQVPPIGPDPVDHNLMFAKHNVLVT